MLSRPQIWCPETLASCMSSVLQKLPARCVGAWPRLQCCVVGRIQRHEITSNRCVGENTREWRAPLDVQKKVCEPQRYCCLSCCKRRGLRADAQNGSSLRLQPLPLHNFSGFGKAPNTGHKPLLAGPTPVCVQHKLIQSEPIHICKKACCNGHQ